jgi:hypothetical protein
MLSGLLIRSPHIGKILDGRKIWEIRGRSTAKRGLIALIQSGTGTVIGAADLVAIVGPLSRSEFAANARKIGLTKTEAGAARRLPYERTFGWVLKHPRRLKTPVPYSHPSGAIIWVNLRPAVQQAILRQLGRRTVSRRIPAGS